MLRISGSDSPMSSCTVATRSLKELYNWINQRLHLRIFIIRPRFVFMNRAANSRVSGTEIMPSVFSGSNSEARGRSAYADATNTPAKITEHVKQCNNQPIAKRRVVMGSPLQKESDMFMKVSRPLSLRERARVRAEKHPFIF